MRVIFALAAIVVVAYAVPSSETSFSEDAIPDTLFLETSNAINLMKKKGATEADCKDLAKTSCKTVEDENKQDQKVIDRQSSGAQCFKIGVKVERKTLTRYHWTKRKHSRATASVKKAKGARINFGYHRFSTLRVGKCRTFYGMRVYINAKKHYWSQYKIMITWTGRVRESLKAYKTAVAWRKRAQYKCHCATKSSVTRTWRTLTKRTRIARQAKAHAKCKMMGCILRNVSLRNKKCRGGLKSLKKKTLTSVTRKTKCRRL